MMATHAATLSPSSAGAPDGGAAGAAEAFEAGAAPEPEP